MTVQWNALLQPVDFAGSVQRGFEWGTRMREAAEDRAWQREQRNRQRGEWQREDQFRGATANMLLGSTNALAAPSVPTGPKPFADAAEPMSGSSAREQAIRANPEGFLTFQGKRLDVTKRDLENHRELNGMAMQLLGGVQDQATYDAAKQRALQLYSSFGQDASQFIAGLPAEYSPELVESLRLQGMETDKQMLAIARENRLEWDIEDDRLDNERADESATSLDRYRSGQLANVRRGQDIRSRDTRRGQTLTDQRGRRGQNIASHDRQRGQNMTDKRVRESAAFRGRYGRVLRDEPMATGPNGESLVVRNGQWVDVRTGKPAQ